MIVNCIVCDVSFTPASAGGENQPYEGTTFMSEGHYGSTVFDPMDGSFLEVNVCDPCLLKASKRQQVLVAQTTRNVFIPTSAGDRVVHAIIGIIRTGTYAPVLWDMDLPSLETERFVISDPEELKSLWPRIESDWSLDKLISMIESANRVEVNAANGNN